MKCSVRLLFWPVLLIGVAFIVLPLVTSMSEKTEAARAMLDGLRPMMGAAEAADAAYRHYDTLAERFDLPEAPTSVALVIQGARPLLGSLGGGKFDLLRLNGLPDVDMLVWVFVVPGVVLLLIAVAALMGPLLATLGRRRATRSAPPRRSRWASGSTAMTVRRRHASTHEVSAAAFQGRAR